MRRSHEVLGDAPDFPNWFRSQRAPGRSLLVDGLTRGTPAPHHGAAFLSFGYSRSAVAPRFNFNFENSENKQLVRFDPQAVTRTVRKSRGVLLCPPGRASPRHVLPAAAARRPSASPHRLSETLRSRQLFRGVSL